jgi:hypothetical protein
MYITLTYTIYRGSVTGIQNSFPVYIPHNKTTVSQGSIMIIHYLKKAKLIKSHGTRRITPKNTFKKCQLAREIAGTLAHFFAPI